MMYAINTENIAQNLHPETTEPVITPGGDNWALEGVLDEAWVEENLISYENDLERAEELMLEAGWERGATDIWELDGEPFQVQMGTDAETPVLEQTVQDQLEAFGIEIEITASDEAAFQDRWEGSDQLEYIEEEYAGSGDFELWAGSDADANNVAGFYDALASHWQAGLSNVWWTRARNYYPHDVQEEGLEEYVGEGWIAAQYDIWEEWTIDLPPIGDPEGEPEPFNPSYTRGAVLWGPYTEADPQPDNPYYDAPHDETHEENAEYYWQKFAWATNYYLPVLPISLDNNQHFTNTANWHWPRDIDAEDNNHMWDYFGETYFVYPLVGMSNILANPDNPKDGASVE